MNRKDFDIKYKNYTKVRQELEQYGSSFTTESPNWNREDRFSGELNIFELGITVPVHSDIVGTVIRSRYSYLISESNRLEKELGITQS